MGLFSFLKKTPEKLEAAGDRYVASKEFGLANIEYEFALDLIEKKHPDETAMAGRVLAKLKQSREALARQHLETGKELLERESVQEAERLFALAYSLTEDFELKQTLKDLMREDVVEASDDAFEGEKVSEPESEKEANTHEDEHAFELLCMTLSDEIGEAYQSYGDEFKEGFLALSRGDFELAVEKLGKALSDHPSEDSHIPVELATALIHLGQTDSAIEHLLRYLEHNPSSFHGVSLLCDIYCDLNQFDLAHGVIEKSPDSLRKSIDGRRLEGRIYYVEGDYPQAEEIFKDALSADEWDPDIARELAMTLAATGKTKEAKELYTDLLNQCSRCGQRINPLDKKAFADLSLEMEDFSEKVLNLYLSLGNDHAELRQDCFQKASFIFSHNGDEKEAARFRKLAGNS